jgi:hypothetical protein
VQGSRCKVQGTRFGVQATSWDVVRELGLNP